MSSDQIECSSLRVAIICKADELEGVVEKIAWEHTLETFESGGALGIHAEVDVLLVDAGSASLSAVSLCERYFPNAAVALFNVEDAGAVEPYLGVRSVRGVFCMEDSEPLMNKGLHVLSQGEYWFPREVLGKAMDLLKVSRDSKDKVTAGVLSHRETELVSCLLQGQSNNEIAGDLNISFHTVKTHLTHIYKKLGVRSRTELMGKLAR